MLLKETDRISLSDNLGIYNLKLSKNKLKKNFQNN